MEKVYIKDQYITLSQLLKLTNLFDSGGFIKHYIQNEGVIVNHMKEFKRGKKLYHQDIVQVDDQNIFQIETEDRG